MARAIVTFARGWHALAVTRSLGRQGIEVFCGEEAPFAPCFFSRYCTGSFQYPSVSKDPEGFLDFMVEKVRELKPPEGEPYVLMPVHKETWLIARHRERFEPHIAVPLTSHANMVRTHDKGQLATLAEQMGITIPATRQFTSLDDLYRAIPSLDFPVFLKIREGASGVGLKKCGTPEELTATFKQFVQGYDLKPDQYPLVQQFVPGDDYCVTALFDHGRPVASMTYRNVRAFPRDTGAGALRETVRLPEAEEAAERLLGELGWHGMAELDFRVAPDKTAYLIEVNPRFFGGLSQAIAANVDYPHMLFRIAAGETIASAPQIDYAARTEAPLVGLLATLDEMAHDDRLWSRFRKVREELGALGRSHLDDVRLRPFWEALKQATNPKDLRTYFKEMFEKHRDTVNDVMQADDPRPALGVLFPMALMLKHGKLSMGVLTSETELTAAKPRRRFRDTLCRPRWPALLLTAALFAISLFAVSADATRNNLGWVLGWPLRVAERIFGSLDQIDPATITGALRYTGYHALNLLFLYIVAALLLRQRPRGGGKGAPGG
ncbi:MAG: ATP-grasp domain-containing protein [Pirellulales bacterium]|nr:ATP-grasp domain-containing protein [Pirellulales bacterium]